MKHFISATQFKTRESLDTFFSMCDGIDHTYIPTTEYWKVANPQYRIETLIAARGKILANLFLEPSTRTRLSFEAAMYKIGGNVITVSDPSNSSGVKGESLEDMVATVSNYANIIALRSSRKGDAERAAKVSRVPIINAGDGSGEHPTQALLDLYTIKTKRTIDNTTVLVCGDLLNGRTVHSLIRLLALYKNMHVVLCSPLELRLPGDLIYWLTQEGVKVSQVVNIKSGLKYKPDVIYMTRLQKERIEGRWQETDAACSWNDQVLESLDGVGEKCLIMHPMPRNEEIPTRLDGDKRCLYLTDQPKNGVRVRTTLIYLMLSGNINFVN